MGRWGPVLLLGRGFLLSCGGALVLGGGGLWEQGLSVAGLPFRGGGWRGGGCLGELGRWYRVGALDKRIHGPCDFLSFGLLAFGLFVCLFFPCGGWGCPGAGLGWLGVCQGIIGVMSSYGVGGRGRGGGSSFLVGRGGGLPMLGGGAACCPVNFYALVPFIAGGVQAG